MLILALCATALGLEPIKLKATAKRVDGKDDAFAYRVDYVSDHVAKLGVGKGHILQQRIVKFYNGENHVGSYFYWQEVGSSLPTTMTSQDLLVKRNLTIGLLRLGICLTHAIQTRMIMDTTFVQ